MSPRSAGCCTAAAPPASAWISSPQELHREANTLGSKSVDVELSQAALELKVLIEQMREQVQNVE